jgi:hypothetical protein
VPLLVRQVLPVHLRHYLLAPVVVLRQVNQPQHQYLHQDQPLLANQRLHLLQGLLLQVRLFLPVVAPLSRLLLVPPPLEVHQVVLLCLHLHQHLRLEAPVDQRL